MIIDSHCHLDDERFDTDREQVIQRAYNAGVQQFIIPSTIANRWQNIKQLTDQFQGVYPSYGLHPMFMQEHQQSDVSRLDEWLDKEYAVAVGECGLDFYTGNNEQKQQLELFKSQLVIAKNHRLPVIIHARKSLDLILRELRIAPVDSGVIHSFSGSLQQAEQLVGLGFKLGIAATVGFERAKKLKEVVKLIDISALLIESDAPDQPGPNHKGHRNEPSYLPEHLEVMADLRGMSKEVLAEQLTANSKQIFGLL